MNWLVVGIFPLLPFLPAAAPTEAEEDSATALFADEESSVEESEGEAVVELPQVIEVPLPIVEAMPSDDEVLIGREPTEAAWRGVRERMQTRFNGLREGMRRPSDSWDFEGALDDWLADVDLFAEYAVALATDDIAEIERRARALTIMSENLAVGYELGHAIRVEATMRQMERVLQELELRSAKADGRAGRVDRWGYSLFPPDWGEPAYRDRMFADALTFYSATELNLMVRERQYRLSRAQLDRIHLDSQSLAREAVELARALATRQAELPEPSRPGFRNVTMRMEVVAENIVSYARERDRHGYSRQVRLLGETVRDAERFLEMIEAPGQ